MYVFMSSELKIRGEKKIYQNFSFFFSLLSIDLNPSHLFFSILPCLTTISCYEMRVNGSTLIKTTTRITTSKNFYFPIFIIIIRDL